MPLFSKNLDYYATKNLSAERISHVAPFMARVGVQAFTELLLMHLHTRVGMTFIVQKKVTDDLLLTDFHESRFEDLPWPAKTVEFNFEDPDLGTMLIGKLTRQEILDEAENINVGLRGHASRPDHNHQMIVLCQSADGSGSCIMVHDEHSWPRLMAGEDLSDMVHTGPGDGRIGKVESDAMIELSKLCLKVLAYSSIPQFKPSPVTRHQLHYGEGKPGVRGRPNRPTFRVIYLPHVIHPTVREPSEASETTLHRTFKGRRGHLRYFRSDYFVNLKGQWKYIAPVVVEEAEHIVVKVRKP